MNDKTLLSVDWDWVTGDCSPSGQDSCCGWCDDPIRKVGGRGIQRCSVTDRDARICKVLDAISSPKDTKFSPHLWVAECHADILRIVEPYSMGQIIHLDSHDDNENWSPLCCGTWRVFLPKSVEVKVSLESGERIDSIFTCLSSPWTPAEFDKEFWSMVEQISRKTMHPEFIGHRKCELKDAWLKYTKGEE